ncbi:MAG: amidase domain-containing protein [Lachnospiraceae bacterium]|nr:amidase domain-containing protein [Lachnospiraceae bacterium]
MNYLNAVSDPERRKELTGVSAGVLKDLDDRITAFTEMRIHIGADFKEVFHNIEITDVQITGTDQVFVLAHETTAVWYSYPGMDDKTDHFAYGTWHRIDLEKHNNSWLILKDSYDERTITGAVSSDLLEEPTNVDGWQRMGSEQYPDRSITFSYNTLGLKMAIKYAIQYCGLSATQRLSNGYVAWRDYVGYGANESNYNPAYHSFGSQGVDCCNFVSQILYAAGVPMDEIWFYDDIYYYSSYEWIAVNDFVSYFEQSFSREDVETNFGNVFPGNPVFWDTDSEDHIMFCVGYDSAGCPVICCHTNDAYRMPLSFAGYLNRPLETLLIASENLHTHNSYQWKANSMYHFSMCTVCDYIHYQSVHTPDLNNCCTVCGAQGPFMVPLN